MSHNRAQSQTRLPLRTRSRSPLAVSRPTTPLRPSSRSSFRTSQNNAFAGPSPLDAFEPQFAELSDSMADLEANLMHLQLMHESLSRFGESFASFLYGLNMNAFVVDFPEAPLPESIKRYQKRQRAAQTGAAVDDTTFLASNAGEPETTILATGDASFTSLKATPRRRTMASTVTPSTTSTTAKQGTTSSSTRGGIPARAGRGIARGGARGSGLPRGRGRAAK
ncbi:DASH complex subunit DAM1 [Exophiala aquamarina CBS 119918]|uniref:DASH complex subunit DAM1 n=1 Tax=Exophiala aquamarina CBS 119918 TaxID=1182545 RepID=A0A072P1M9_9EURO|nr:DASH complex subunit DAM1 [Exophiala aquamarina CBS 119918]KEF53731.1 DASH complex subunit DAM1 [Exophiala aquamarina CBS 119918]